MSGPGLYISPTRPSSYSFQQVTELLQSAKKDDRRDLIRSLDEDAPGRIGPYPGSMEEENQFNNELNHRVLGKRMIYRTICPSTPAVGNLEVLLPAETRRGSWQQVPEVTVVNTTDNEMVIDCDMAIIVTEGSHEVARRVGTIKCSWTKSEVTVELVGHAYKCSWMRESETNLLQIPILELWIWDIVCLTGEWEKSPERAHVIFRGEHTCMEIGCLQEHLVDDRLSLLAHGHEFTQQHGGECVWKYPTRLALTNERRRIGSHRNLEMREFIRQLPVDLRVVETKCNWSAADMAFNISAGTTVVYARSMQSIAKSTASLASMPQVEVQTDLEQHISLQDTDHLAQSYARYPEYRAKYEQEDAHQGLIENGRTIPHSNATRPPKMYSITSQKVVETAIWSEDEWQKSFFLSYVWGQWTDDSLVERLSELGRSFGWHHCWVDRWCIDQASSEDKQEQLPKMGDYYEGAREVVVLMPEIAGRWRGLVETRGQMIQADAMCDVNRDFLKQYGLSQWMHRVWTFQEGYRASNILLATQTQVLDMIVVNTIYKALFRDEWFNGFLTIAGLTTLASATTDSSNHLITHISQAAGAIAARKRLIQGDPSPKMDTNLAGMLLATAHRACTVEQDRLHAIMGIAKDANIEVDYRTSLGNRLRALARQGDLDSRILLGNTVSKTANECWLPDFGEGKVVSQSISDVDATSIKPLRSGGVEVQARKVTGKIDKDIFIMSGFEKVRVCHIETSGRNDLTTEDGDTFLIVKGSDKNGRGLLLAGKASTSARILHRRWGKVINVKEWQLVEPIEAWEIGDIV